MELLSTDAANINQEEIINNVVFSLSSSCLQILLWTAHKYLEHIVGNMPLIVPASAGSKLWCRSSPDSVCQQQRKTIDHITSPFGSLSAHDYLAWLALSQMSQNNLRGMCLFSRAKYRARSLIRGKSFGIVNCLQLKIVFLGIYEQSEIRAYFASSKSINLCLFAIYFFFLNHLQSPKYLGSWPINHSQSYSTYEQFSLLAFSFCNRVSLLKFPGNFSSVSESSFVFLLGYG